MIRSRRERVSQAVESAVSRRRMLQGLAATTAAVVVGSRTGMVSASPLAKALTPPQASGAGRPGSGTVLLYDNFRAPRLNPRIWNPYICDNPSHGYPWNIQPNVALPSSAIGGENGTCADYDLPSAVKVGDGLVIEAHNGTEAAGYSWTSGVICTYPTNNDFGSGVIHTPGFTFTEGYVEVMARMPPTGNGMWPALWFLPGPGGDGPEIDLFEGGFVDGDIDPNRVMQSNLHDGPNGQQQVLFDTGVDLSRGHHRYAMEYRSGELLRMYFADRLVVSYSEALPTGPYYIIIDNAVASSQTAPWHAQLTSSTPSPNRLEVSYVLVRSLPAR